MNAKQELTTNNKIFEDILRETILLAPPLNQYLLWGLKLLDSDRNLRDMRDRREAMPQEQITAEHSRNLFLWQTYFFFFFFFPRKICFMDGN